MNKEHEELLLLIQREKEEKSENKKQKCKILISFTEFLSKNIYQKIY